MAWRERGKNLMRMGGKKEKSFIYADINMKDDVVEQFDVPYNTNAHVWLVNIILNIIVQSVKKISVYQNAK